MPEHRLPLGALSFGGHRILETELGKGDLVVAYSDGVVDAQSPDGRFFGEDRLAQTLENAPAEPQAAVNFILEEIDAFTCGHRPYDDVTLLAAAWSPEESNVQH
jgi:sigma-B regulation protein RsbU (phosphoserine phosphatase)